MKKTNAITSAELVGGKVEKVIKFENCAVSSKPPRAIVIKATHTSYEDFIGKKHKKEIE